MTNCISSLETCTCVICGQLVSNMTTTLSSKPPVYRETYPTPQSLPRLGTQFTPGIGETPVDDTKEGIPFQDLSKLAKRQDWAVIKMTNVFLLNSYLMEDPLGFHDGSGL